MPQTNQTNHAAGIKLAPPREPIPSFWQGQRWEIAGLLAVIICCAIALKRLEKNKKTPSVPASAQALRELEALRGRPQAELATETARVLRRFVLARFDLLPEEPTTAELSGALQRQGGVPRDVAGRVADFLRRCDALKFSPDATAPETDLLTEAFEIVDQVDAVESAEPPVIPGAAP